MSLIPNFNAGGSVVTTFKAVASYYSTVNQLMTGGPAIPILFDSPNISPIDISLNPVNGEMTFNRTGLYKVFVDITFGNTVPGSYALACWLTINGSAVPNTHRTHNITDNPPTSSTHEWFVPITIGDILTVDIGSSAGPTTIAVSFPPPIPFMPSASINILQID